MRKLLIAFLSMLFLSGCANSEDLPKRILTQLQELPSVELAAGSNMNKKYYSYYLPGGIGRKDSNALSEVFVKNGYHLVMNFDPNAIIASRLYAEDQHNDRQQGFIEPTFQQDGNKYTYTGNYVTNSDEVYAYMLKMIESEQNYLLYFDGTIVKLYTYVPKAEVMGSLKSMIRIASSVYYEEEKILKNYSIKDMEQAKNVEEEYIVHNLPSSGSLQELLVGSESNAGHGGDSTE